MILQQFLAVLLIASTAVSASAQGRKAPILREMDLTGIRIDHEGKANGPKEQRNGTRSTQYPTDFKIVPIRVQDLDKYCYDQQEVAKMRRQFDPDGQQLVMVYWHSWTGGRDQLALEVRDDSIDFILRIGPSLMPRERGKPTIPSAPSGPTIKAFAVRKGIKWVECIRPHPEDVERQDEQQEPKPAFQSGKEAHQTKVTPLTAGSLVTSDVSAERAAQQGKEVVRATATSEPKVIKRHGAHMSTIEDGIRGGGFVTEASCRQTFDVSEVLAGPGRKGEHNVEYSFVERAVGFPLPDPERPVTKGEKVVLVLGADGGLIKAIPDTGANRKEIEAIIEHIKKRKVDGGKIDAPKPLPPDAAKAWQQAGARPGWMKDLPPAPKSGHFFCEPFCDKVEPETIPAFRFHPDDHAVLAKLPDPGVPFGLDFHCSAVSGPWLRNMAGLKSLRSLNIGGALTLTDHGLKEVAALKDLQGLYLFYAHVTDAGLKELAGLEDLRVLDLSHTQVKGPGLKNLASLKNLQGLNLSYTKVTDAGLKELAGMTSLQWLSLHGTEATAAGVTALQKDLPKCRIVAAEDD